MEIHKKINAGNFVYQEYELLSTLRKNPTIIMAGDDICAVAADEIESLQERIEELEKALELFKNPSCEGVTGHAVNEVGWFISEQLRDRGVINGAQFNHLKPTFCDALKLYAKEILND